MRKILIITVIFSTLSCPAYVSAADEFGGFKAYATRGSLKPFARDLGSVLGSASFHNGRSLGFSGFDVGARGGVLLRTSPDDKILRDRGIKMLGLPWVQAEIGLPFRLDGYIRGISYQGITIAGGGLRYGITKYADKPLKPQFLLAGSAHSVAHRYFSASHFGGNIIASIMVKVVTFYMGGGVDRTRIVVRTVPVQAPALEGEAAVVVESRFTGGVSVHPYKYVYLYAAGTLTHGEAGLDTGLGIRF